ncbi:MAG: hypothetical protein Q8922_13075 [Bacteroidota bacterium]|nr:hypothetical protein [Bacteroidota bacterium]MDP4234696.1 hypothetical protein [Bacteroidota bacterium]MDP4243920.1 hypothetical protein [Bacteroidota bacterium]MDP4288858.1 hypothetical protein [Bacteroidota bacterium]
MPQFHLPSDSTISEPVVPDLEPDVHLLHYLEHVARHKWVAMFLVIAFGAAFLAATYIMPYTYTTFARLLPPDRLSSSGLLSSLNASYALTMLKEIENPSVDLMQNLLESRFVSDRLTQDSVVRTFYADEAETQDEMAKLLRDDLLVDPHISKVDLHATVSTSWFSTDAEKEVARKLPARIISIAVHTMDSLLMALSKGDASSQLLYAQEDYRTRKLELDSITAEQEAFEREHGIVQLKTQTIAAIEQMASIQADRDEAQMEAATLSRDLTERNPKRAMATARAVAASEALQRYRTHSTVGPAFDEMPEVNREYASILLRRSALEPVVSYLNREVEQQKINVTREKSVITVLDAAHDPDVRSSPKRMTMLLLGFAVGVLASCLYLGFQAMRVSVRRARYVSTTVQTSR